MIVGFEFADGSDQIAAGQVHSYRREGVPGPRRGASVRHQNLSDIIELLPSSDTREERHHGLTFKSAIVRI